MPSAKFMTKPAAYLPEGFNTAEDLELAARRCAKIINKITGREFARPEPYDWRCRWEDLFREAKFNPKTFHCEEEASPKMVVPIKGEDGPENREVYSRGELDTLGMPRLREIGNLYDIKDVSKSGMILKILQAQDALVIKANQGR
jgi:hypothetical protein